MKININLLILSLFLIPNLHAMQSLPSEALRVGRDFPETKRSHAQSMSLDSEALRADAGDSKRSVAAKQAVTQLPVITLEQISLEVQQVPAAPQATVAKEKNKEPACCNCSIM